MFKNTLIICVFVYIEWPVHRNGLKLGWQRWDFVLFWFETQLYFSKFFFSIFSSCFFIVWASFTTEIFNENQIMNKRTYLFYHYLSLTFDCYFSAIKALMAENNCFYLFFWIQHIPSWMWWMFILILDTYKQSPKYKQFIKRKYFHSLLHYFSFNLHEIIFIFWWKYTAFSFPMDSIDSYFLAHFSYFRCLTFHFFPNFFLSISTLHSYTLC